MWRKIILKVIGWLYPLTYEPITLDKINHKLIRPVPGLIIKGMQYFEFVNVDDMPETRRMEYNNLREEAVIGLSRAMMIEMFDNIIVANDKGEGSKVGAIAFMAKDMLANITTKEILYKTASLMYFDELEDISMYDADYNKKKIELFKTEIDDEGFFFGRLLDNGSKNTGDPLHLDIKKFLRDSEVKEKAYLRLITEMLVPKGTANTSRPSRATAKE